MLRKSMAGVLSMAMLLGMALVASAADKGKDVKKEGKEVKGVITKIDKAKMTFVLNTDDGKVMDYKVAETTKFIGPKGGVSEKGVKDDRFAVGAKVTLLVSKDGKVVQEVHLPVRSKSVKDKAKAPK